MVRSLAASVAAVVLCAGAQGSIVPVGPFTGERSDALNYPDTTIVSRFSLFGGAGSLRSHDGVLTTIHYLITDTFIGDIVTPRTGGHILGFTQGPGVFEFDPPVRRFGAYFNNNSGMNDATCDFFGTGGDLLGSLVATTPSAGNQWVWNGWESDAPIARIVVTGNGVIDGFLWFDDLEISTVPGPGGVVLGVLALLHGQRRRR